MHRIKALAFGALFVLTLKRTFEPWSGARVFRTGLPGSAFLDCTFMSDIKTNQDTRERLLDVAEHLFMVHGYDGTSMRIITGAAEVNLAAVNYHFGSKEALLREVFRRRLTWLNRERLRALDALEAQSGGAPLKPSLVLEAFFGTLLRMGEDPALGGMTFLRLLGRTLTEPADFIRTFFAGEYAEVIERYKLALFRALPDVPRAEIVWRLHFMLGAMSYAIAGTDILQVVTGCAMDDIAPGDSHACADQRNEAQLLSARLMPFLLGGLRAPLPGC
jgi:AcrR family transcriptional regulator